MFLFNKACACATSLVLVPAIFGVAAGIIIAASACGEREQRCTNCEYSATPTELCAAAAERCPGLPLCCCPGEEGKNGFSCVLVLGRGVWGPRRPTGGNCCVSYTESDDGEGGGSGRGDDVGPGGCSGTTNTTAAAGASGAAGTKGSLGCNIPCSHEHRPSMSSSGGISPMPMNSNSLWTSSAFWEMHVNSIIMSTSSKRESCRQMCMSMIDLPEWPPVRLKNTVYFSCVSSKETSSGVCS
jgi:hypothetical protein